MNWRERAQSTINSAMNLVSLRLSFVRKISKKLYKKSVRILKISKEFLWPSIGWRRFFRLTMIRISRLTGGDKSISKGFACGSAISMTPFIGFHFVISAAMAKLMKGNIIAAIVGTAVGNPWSFPFIWAASYSLGSWMLERQEDHDFSHAPLDLWALIGNPWDIFFPMLLGSIPMMLIAWPLSYWLIMRMLGWLRKKKAKRKVKRLAKRLSREKNDTVQGF